ncbi:LLM class flavin-dependent oxidoreductase [Tengunoibacter tsumagoiensis]|uniref:LLM class F420-dependent oxidoreductase n=1 Tax=Tengunoibacter tsumagoiensis TaxID=2014871 RepID=A0A402A5M5_9CHLR|nr:LLM class flavin-dependent oxidoreductase [Tengunoibacter tsumagoiensis]GCE14443.1 LLM class F420-dependent oxidoreductase [Tengunoibacter tsumagoiensis]
MHENQFAPTGAPQPPVRSLRERVGLVIDGTQAQAAVKAIVEAEAAGVRQVWSIQAPTTPDTLTTFAAAAVQTKTIRLGTAIVPTYPRHPLTLAMQVLSIYDLAPDRLRLGVGPSHKPMIEGVYGLHMTPPIEHLREYVGILRALLWEGKIDHHSNNYNIVASLPRTARVPILISALRENAYQLAGEISDGAIPWLCPIPYLLKTALPALQRGAANRNRPTPPIVAHVLAAASSDRAAVLAATRKQIAFYGTLPFYAHMFADAGFPVSEQGVMSDDLVNSLVISGTEEQIAARFKEILSQGLEELLVLPVPVSNPEQERTRLAQLIGRLDSITGV